MQMAMINYHLLGLQYMDALTVSYNAGLLQVFKKDPMVKGWCYKPQSTSDSSPLFGVCLAGWT